MKIVLLIALLFFLENGNTQVPDSIIKQLKIDSTFAFFQYQNPELAKSLKSQLENAKNEKFVIYHFGGSHIQAETPPTHARRLLQNKYGNGGRGMIFSYGAADTYSSVNYSSTKTGSWSFGKSFQGNPKVPLGVCGMGVETKQVGATLDFKFKETIPKAKFILKVLTDEDSLNYAFDLSINDLNYDFEYFKHIGHGIYEIALETEIASINLKTKTNNPKQKQFRFYGIDIENIENSGVVYHSLGVGAAAFRSVLQLDCLERQSKVLKPDMVILDFGTNDILYTNSIDPKLAKTVEKAIAQFREINPEILIVLTSTQDLYRKGKYITAGVSFVSYMDSLAKQNNCFFWNWYDLAGGYGTITAWRDLKFAKTDGIHLTTAGYKLKGELLYHSIENTITHFDKDNAQSLLIAQKEVKYDNPLVDTTLLTNVASTAPMSAKKISKKGSYVVKKGDTLSAIANRNKTTVQKIKKVNNLKSDTISIGQRLKIPN